MEELMIKVDNVTKEYRLGAIGGGTLQGDLQSWWAEKRGKEDPNSKIGAKVYGKNERFLALDGISFEVKKGERIGIIGHNGAGKSTLLKLISRVTAPTTGEIGLNGRVTSMLEVGTGFHGELTGRENIYMNGAILGMNKKEIDAKIEEIIDFSECRQFIDTPVKRYSSGMYVKLAFSVAAHLDSEIMIMDEVLAVGDMAFQNKCINKMREVADSGRTILYVSHNMATIRRLCNRCIVLEQGQLIFDGDIEAGISKYIYEKADLTKRIDLSKERRPYRTSKLIQMQYVEFVECEQPIYSMGDKSKFRIAWDSKREFESIRMRIGVFTLNQDAVSVSFTNPIEGHIGMNVSDVEVDISHLQPGKYFFELIMNEISTDGQWFKHDVIDRDVVSFEITMPDDKPVYRLRNESWGRTEIESRIINTRNN